MISRTPVRITLLGLILITAAACQPADPIGEARTLQELGDYSASLEVLRERLEEAPRDAEARYLYGLALSNLSRPSEAQWSLREAMRDEVWLEPAALVLVNDALTTGNYHSALQVVNEMLERNPSSIEALQLRATASIMSRRGYETALEDAERIIELDPEHPDAGVLRAIALLGLYRIEEAEEQLYAAAEKREDAAPGVKALYCATMVDFFVQNEDLDQAEEQVGRCRRDHPDSAPVLFKAIEFFDERDERDKSLAILEQALADKPRDLAVRSNLAQRLVRLRRAPEAEELMKQAVGFERGVASVPARLELFSFYRATRDGRKAAEALEEALEILGPAVEPRMQLALVEAWVGLEEYAAAEAIAEQISDPAHRAFADGNIAVFRGDNAHALERYSEGYKTWPNSAPARYYGAYAAEQLGLFDRAIDEYRYSIRADPSATDARTRLARLFVAEGELNLALDTILVDVQDSPLDPDGVTLSVETAARLGRAATVANQLAQLDDRPGLRAQAVAAAARGVARGAGEANGARFIEQAKLDLTDPRQAEALRTLVTLRAQMGDVAQAHEAVRVALEAAPTAPVFHEIRGLLLERYGDDDTLAVEAYQQALALRPGDSRALAGMARIRFKMGAAEAALGLFERAHVADASDGGIARAYAAALIRVGREADARAILEQALEENPVDGRAARALGRLLQRESPAGEAALELARRAARFDAGPESFELLAECLATRGEAEDAAEARAKAAAYREASAATEDSSAF